MSTACVRSLAQTTELKPASPRGGEPLITHRLLRFRHDMTAVHSWTLSVKGARVYRTCRCAHFPRSSCPQHPAPGAVASGAPTFRALAPEQPGGECLAMSVASEREEPRHSIRAAGACRDMSWVSPHVDFAARLAFFASLALGFCLASSPPIILLLRHVPQAEYPSRGVLQKDLARAGPS